MWQLYTSSSHVQTLTSPSFKHLAQQIVQGCP